VPRTAPKADAGGANHAGKYQKGRNRMRPFAAVAAAATALVCAAGGAHAQVTQSTFRLFPNPTVLACLEQTAGVAPVAVARVVEGSLNDTLTIVVKNLKPNLAFDLFTVQRSSLLANHTPDPNFTNFGLAWYQSDLQADTNGTATTAIRTILVDQIFGFDPAVSLAPTNTFHVGFWFNNPQDAVPCGFNATKPTPFNGEHKAGPLAMITVPNATTGLGPLCLNPNTATTPATCKN
jgi:hypothetical protein